MQFPQVNIKHEISVTVHWRVGKESFSSFCVPLPPSEAGVISRNCTHSFSIFYTFIFPSWPPAVFPLCTISLEELLMQLWEFQIIPLVGVVPGPHISTSHRYVCFWTQYFLFSTLLIISINTGIKNYKYQDYEFKRNNNL